ncbi:hypothetical protein KAW18_02355 [candidate division WOR-3 bacterium]|nr:hypothetical protein [candidate division WOR-3 bacterium]
MEIPKDQMDALEEYLGEEERKKKGFKTRTELLQERADEIVKNELWKKSHRGVIKVIT